MTGPLSDYEGKELYQFDGTEASSDALHRELILHIAGKSAADPTFGDTKLNKLLYFADMTAYAHFGRPITGVAYRKLQYGPAPVRLVPVRTAMEADGDIVRQRGVYGDNPQNRVIPLRPPKLHLFTAADISVVDAILTQFESTNAREVSAISHALAAWRLAKDNELIPYQAFLISDEPPSDYQVARAQELAREYELYG